MLALGVKLKKLNDDQSTDRRDHDPNGSFRAPLPPAERVIHRAFHVPQDIPPFHIHTTYGEVALVAGDDIITTTKGIYVIPTEAQPGAKQ